MNIDKILSNCKDYHLPASIFVFVIGAIEHHVKGLDASFVAFTATVLGAITGHAFSPAQQDPPTSSQPPNSDQSPGPRAEEPS